MSLERVEQVQGNLTITVNGDVELIDLDEIVRSVVDRLKWQVTVTNRVTPHMPVDNEQTVPGKTQSFLNLMAVMRNG